MASVAEPEISLSIEQVFPSTVPIESLRAYRERFPLVSVNLFTEGLGAPKQGIPDADRATVRRVLNTMVSKQLGRAKPAAAR
jgi:hypothetical protein